MKTSIFLSLLFIIFSSNCYSQSITAKFPFFKVKGSELKTILDSNDSLEASISISGNVATVKFIRFPHGNSTGMETTIKFNLQTNPRKFSINENVPLRCYGTHIDFVIDTSKVYWLVPTPVLDSRSGKTLMSYRIKDSPSLTAPSYKNLNPVPPGPPGYIPQ
jgi:hypothetical protein